MKKTARCISKGCVPLGSNRTSAGRVRQRKARWFAAKASRTNVGSGSKITVPRRAIDGELAPIPDLDASDRIATGGAILRVPARLLELDLSYQRNRDPHVFRMDRQ